MKQLKTIAIVQVVLLLITSLALAQTTKLPRNDIFFMDYAPKGFVHMHEQQSFNQVIIEFLPDGETLENWTQMLSLGGTPIADKVPSLSRYIDLYFSSYTNACKQLDIEPVSEQENEIIVNVSCLTREGSNIPGGKDLKWENGVYRFIKASKMVYQVHFVTHGVELPDQAANQQYMEQAEIAVKQVLICNLGGSEPCPPVDIYISADKTPVPVEGIVPPCREQGFACNPAAMIEVSAADKSQVDPEKKTAMIIVDFTKEDITEQNVLRKYIITALNSLKQGSPGALLLLRGGSPNAEISAQDRVKAGNFISFVRMALVAQKAIDPDLTKVMFINFN